MNAPLPKKIIRMDDGAEFLLNEVTQTYSLWYPKMEEHLNHEYTYERLMEDPRNKGIFKIADGTEDLMAMRKALFERMNSRKYDNE